MELNKYIINDFEITLLNQAEGITGGIHTSDAYMECTKEGLAQLCAIKDRSNDLFTRRYMAARAVIDIIAKKVGIDPTKDGLWLYAPDADGSTPIVARIDNWISKSGEKAQLKRRVQELEQENAILRSLLQK